MNRPEPSALQALIEAYGGLGGHRTGSPGDAATSAWLVGQLRRLGLDARAEPFAFSRNVVRAAHVIAHGVRIEGTPLYDGGATGPEGRRARFAVFEDALPVEFGRHGTESPGAILVTGDPEGHVLLRNAEAMDAPLAVPVLQVARRDAGPLRQSGGEAHLVIDRVLAPGTATNVVASLPAAGAEGLVVVMTPKSGWFGCAAERGGGIAIALALAQAAAAMPRRKAVRFLFTSGHELGHRGLLGYLERHPELRHEAAFWLQLGASLGARDATQMRVFTREEGLRDWFPRELERQGIAGATLAERELRPHGESREVFEHPFLSMAGRHPYFHSPLDEPARSVDAECVARHVRAFGALLERQLS